MTALGALDHLDGSLEDLSSYRLPTPQTTETTATTTATTTTGDTDDTNSYQRPQQYGRQSTHSGFRSDDLTSEATGEEDEEDLDSEVSAGGYSPPAWRRLGNGDRSSGFWGKSDDLFQLLNRAAEEERAREEEEARRANPAYASEGGEDLYDDEDEILAQAIRTRLPTGSLSPEEERSPEPESRIQNYSRNQHGYQQIDHVVGDKMEVKDFAVGRVLKQESIMPKEGGGNGRFFPRRVRPLSVSLLSLSTCFFVLCPREPVANHISASHPVCHDC
jgi:hypothetical protein